MARAAEPMLPGWLVWQSTILNFLKELLKCYFSIIRRLPKLSQSIFAGTIFDRIRIVLCQTSHPGNIGPAARAMKTMGLQHLYLVKPDKFPDAHATALATGAADLLERAVVTETLSEALTGCAFAIGDRKSVV